MARTFLTVTSLEDRTTPTTLPSGFTDSVLATGLTQPTSMAIAPDGRIFVTEKTGDVRIVQNGTVLATPFLSLTVDSQGERGLLGLDFDPNFSSNGFVYLYYTVPAADGGPFNRVVRVTANGNVGQTGTLTTILTLDPLSSATNHNGGAIHFGPDGKLYIGVGENGNGSNSQSLANRLGKILRVNPDGSIPSDNPTTIDGLGTPTGANGSIWAAGLRNPYTFAFDPSTGELFINDVGGGSFEEINRGQAGANYGWPTTEGTFDPASFPNFTNPIYAYAHGFGPLQGNAISGGAFYRGSQFPTSLTGDYFFADFVVNRIYVRDSATGQVITFADNLDASNPVDLDVTPSGDLLYLSISDGQIHRISFTSLPVGGTPATLVAAGAGPGGSQAKLVDPGTGAATLTIEPFPGFTGGIRVASADLNRDGVPELIVGPGPGAPPRVVIYDGSSGAELRSFTPFESSFLGGMFVSAGDFNADGVADIVVSPDIGGGPRVTVIDGATGSILADFFGIDDSNFRGGVRVGVGDIDHDGTPDLVVAAGAGGGPRIAVWNGTTLRPGATPARLVNDFFAFEPTLRDGAFAAVGDVDGDSFADLVTGAGPGGSPRILVFAGSDLLSNLLTPLASFFAGDENLRTGISVAARDITGDGRAEVIAGAAPGTPPNVTPFQIAGGTATPLPAITVFDSDFTGGVFVG